MTRPPLFLIAASTAALIAACSEPEAREDAAEAFSAGEQTASSGTDHGGMDHGEMDGDDMHAETDHGDMNHGEMADGDMHAGMDHGGMDHGGMTAAEATAEGVVNTIDPDAGSVNITHPPMPEINWPERTMDIPVTGTVDLSGFSEGDTVRFTVRRGRDDVFRIVEMTPAEADE